MFGGIVTMCKVSIFRKLIGLGVYFVMQVLIVFVKSVKIVLAANELNFLTLLLIKSVVSPQRTPSI